MGDSQSILDEDVCLVNKNALMSIKTKVKASLCGDDDLGPGTKLKIGTNTCSDKPDYIFSYTRSMSIQGLHRGGRHSFEEESWT